MKGLTNVQKGTVYFTAIFIEISNRFNSDSVLQLSVSAFQTKLQIITIYTENDYR